MQKLKGEIALVTGGSRGIGRAIAVALGAEGAEVVVNYVSAEAKALETCKLVEAAGGKATAVKFNVADPDETTTAIEGILKDKKKISILVNNAGISKDGLMLRYPTADWDQVLATNLRGAFITSQAVIRNMMKERRGSIIHMSSIIGLTGNVGQTVYAAAKAGLFGLTKSMAKEFASRNVRVNAVAPGYIETDMTSDFNEEQKKAFVAQIPLQRIGKAEDVASAVVYLASPGSEYVTGQTLVVDGGLSL